MIRFFILWSSLSLCCSNLRFICLFSLFTGIQAAQGHPQSHESSRLCWLSVRCIPHALLVPPLSPHVPIPIRAAAWRCVLVCTDRSNDSLTHFYLPSADKVTHPPHSKSRDAQTANVCLVIPYSTCDSCFSTRTVFQAHSDKSSAKVSAKESKPPTEPVAPAVPLFVPPPGSYMSAAAVAAINARAVAAAASTPTAGSVSLFTLFLLNINTLTNHSSAHAGSQVSLGRCAPLHQPVCCAQARPACAASLPQQARQEAAQALKMRTAHPFFAPCLLRFCLSVPSLPQAHLTVRP